MPVAQSSDALSQLVCHEQLRSLNGSDAAVMRCLIQHCADARPRQELSVADMLAADITLQQLGAVYQLPADGSQAPHLTEQQKHVQNTITKRYN